MCFYNLVVLFESALAYEQRGQIESDLNVSEDGSNFRKKLPPKRFISESTPTGSKTPRKKKPLIESDTDDDLDTIMVEKLREEEGSDWEMDEAALAVARKEKQKMRDYAALSGNVKVKHSVAGVSSVVGGSSEPVNMSTSNLSNTQAAADETLWRKKVLDYLGVYCTTDIIIVNIM